MPKIQNFCPRLSYREAKVCRYGTDTYIVFYALNSSGKLQREKIRVNSVIASSPTAKKAEIKLREICKDLNSRLAAGWSPFVTVETGIIPCACTLIEAAAVFISSKAKEVRPDTMRCYSSFCNKLSAWLRVNCPEISPNQFTKLQAVQFLDEQYITMNSPRSYNNMLKLGRTLFSWLSEHGYSEVNPFMQVRAKRTFAKKRQLIPARDRQLITEYLQDKDPVFLLYLKLVFVSLIRPKEIRELKVKDVLPGECRIVIRPEVAKTHEERSSICPPEIIADLVRLLHIESRHPEELLFYGNSKNYYLRRWQAMRIALNLPETYQMYSFRDSGITEYLRSGLDTLTVMQLAGHSDLKITSIYARHADNSIYIKMSDKSLCF